MGIYKNFDANLFLENDSKSRLAVLRYLDSQGMYAIPNPDIYGPDIILYRGLRPYSYIEVEVKKVWQGAEFPWDTIQLPYRKAKFLELGLPIEFYIFNSTLDHAIIIPDYALAKVIPTEVRNKYIEAGEMFYQIPLEQCSLVKLK